MSKKTIVFVLVIAAAALAVFVATKKQKTEVSPVQVTTNLYTTWTKSGQNYLADKSYQKLDFFTPQFIGRLNATLSSFEKGGYDPVLCAQDIPSSFSVLPVTESPKKAQVFVNEIYGNKQNRVAVSLLNTESGWKIDAIQCPRDESVSPDGNKPAVKPDFIKNGNLVKDEGKPDWYLVYEEPGKPALKVKLQLPDMSTAKFTIGQRVNVEGKWWGNIVIVSKISAL